MGKEPPIITSFSPLRHLGRLLFTSFSLEYLTGGIHSVSLLCDSEPGVGGFVSWVSSEVCRWGSERVRGGISYSSYVPSLVLFISTDEGPPVSTVFSILFLGLVPGKAFLGGAFMVVSATGLWAFA